MKAIIRTKYGSPDVLRLQDVPIPTPGADEVLVQIRAASVNQADWHLLTADSFLVRLTPGGPLRPRNTRLGADLAGRVEAVGRNVSQFRPGDEVFGDIGAPAGRAFAEYAAVPATALARKPANLSFEQAAAAPLAGVTALQGLRDEGQIRPGQKVLIQGASGGVGTFALQIAKSFGAEVTAVCSTRNLEQARTLGADHVIDYTQEDFTQSGRAYDLIVAVNGSYPISAYKRALAPNGTYVVSGGPPAQIFRALLLGRWLSRGGGWHLRVLSARPNPEDLAALGELLESGRVVPVIDRRYSLAEVPDALRYFGQGHARGKVVIVMDHDST